MPRHCAPNRGIRANGFSTDRQREGQAVQKVGGSVDNGWMAGGACRWRGSPQLWPSRGMGSGRNAGWGAYATESVNKKLRIA
jgi:hypothetical protein